MAVRHKAPVLARPLQARKFKRGRESFACRDSGPCLMNDSRPLTLSRVVPPFRLSPDIDHARTSLQNFTHLITSFTASESAGMLYSSSTSAGKASLFFL